MSENSNIWEIDPTTKSWIVPPLTRRGALRAGAGAALGLTALGALAACGGSDGASSSSAAGSSAAAGLPGEGKTIALSLNGFNTYDQNTAEGVLKALEGTGYTLIGAEAGFDATKEVDNIKQLVARQPAGLIVLAASAEGAARASLAAKDAGIPVFTQIWFPSTPEADSVYFGATALDEDAAGQMVIDFIVKDQGITSGNILEVVGLDAQPFSEGYKAGLRKALEQYPDLKVVASQQGFYTADGAIKVLKPMLTAHPDTNIILDYAAEMGNAIAQELERQERKDICHITSDGNAAMNEWLKKEDGAYLKACRWFSPGSEGVAAVNAIRNKIEKNENPTTENIGVEGYVLDPGTADPVVIWSRQEIATAANIDSLPASGFPEFTDKIPVGG